MTIKRAVFRNFTLAWSGQVIGLVIGLGTIGIVTRTLGIGGYGTYATALVFLATLSAVINFGLPAALLQMMGRGEIEEERVVGGVFLLRMLIGLVGFALAPVLVRALFDYPPVVHELVPIGAGAFFFSYLSGALGTVFQRHLQVGRHVAVTLLERGLFLLAMTVWSRVSGAPQWALACLALSNAIGLGLRLVLVRPLVVVRPRFEGVVWRTALHTSWPMALMATLGLLCTQSDMLLLADHREKSVAGTYGLSRQILTLLVGTIPAQLVTLLLPVLARAWKQGDRAGFRDQLQTALDFLILALLPIVAGTQLVADDLVVLLGGPEFVGSGDVLRIHVLAAAALFVGMLYRYAGLAVEVQHRLIIPTVVVASATMAAYFVLIPQHGMWAAAWTRVGHASVGAVATIAVVSGAIRMMPSFRVTARGALATLVMVGALLLLRGQHIVLAMGGAVVVYGVAVLLTGAVTPHQVRAVLSAIAGRRSQ